MTHICVGTPTITGSINGLSPGRHQAIIWTKAGILLIGPLGTNFNEISINIHTFSFNKVHFKMSSGKWRPFCLARNVLNQRHRPCMRGILYMSREGTSPTHGLYQHHKKHAACDKYVSSYGFYLQVYPMAAVGKCMASWIRVGDREGQMSTVYFYTDALHNTLTFQYRCGYHSKSCHDTWNLNHFYRMAYRKWVSFDAIYKWND